jgi:hypothetical protein
MKKQQYYVGIGRMNGRPMDIIIAPAKDSKGIADGISKHGTNVVQWQIGPGLIDVDKLPEVVLLIATHSIPAVPNMWLTT